MRVKFDQKILQKLVKEALPGKSEIAPVEDGIVTNVFKIKNKGQTYYLRITAYEGQGYQAEVIAHQKILSAGAKVPKIIYHRNYCPEINNRSFMITEEIPGKPLSEYDNWKEMDKVFIDSGKDLARIHSIPVEGFGWIERKAKNIKKLYAHRDSYQDYLFRNLQEKITTLIKFDILTQSEAKRLQELKNRFPKFLDYDQAYLTHGDFDVTHIYCDQGKYTGIIDFGDIIGASAYADLAHFMFFTHPSKDIFPCLLEGYQTVKSLPGDIKIRLNIEGILIAINKLSYIAETMPERISNHYAIPQLKKGIAVLSSKL